MQKSLCKFFPAKYLAILYQKNISLLEFSKRKVKIMKNFVKFAKLFTFLVKFRTLKTLPETSRDTKYRIICNEAAVLIALITVGL